ncbi:MAG: adenosylcobalamin-dependent ribonucleoside-diphosphate reductase [Deltaproteobacteria bacterium]|nr:adenosylcobalamin-dependent ribonucleoside-diphosphate reductase [Deltaproteobacteria bacterium]
MTDHRFTRNAQTVLESRYLMRTGDGNVIESPDQMFRRVARAVAAPDANHGKDPRIAEERFFARMERLELLPNSPALMNAGRPLGQLAACFVVPVGDSMAEIFDAVKWAAQIQMTGGGTGFSFSRLRPAGDLVSSTGRRASGPLAFMDVFDCATDAVRQGGTRRGANMGVLRVDHPDVLEFIAAKLNPGRLRNFNVSVGLTDAFMAAVEDGTDYPLVNPRTHAEVRRLDARRVFDLMARVAWRTGDPGVIFLDRINAAHPTPELGCIECTNPCGEQPLLPFESCVLASLNVAKFAAPNGQIDTPALRGAVFDAVHFLDNLIDANRYPLREIEEVTRANRKIGLGVMGLADLLIEMGIPYDSDRALEVAGELAAFVERESLAASAQLAEERGPFPSFPSSRWAKTGVPPLRNATTTTVAPTGTISIIAGCSSGIEPLFGLMYVRSVLDGEKLLEVHPRFRKIAEERGFWSEELATQLAAAGRARGLPQVPTDIQALFPTAHDLEPETHVRMQAVFQRHVHAAVSKTVNFPASARPEDVARVYKLAYQLGCKGVTVYRDGSRSGQVLSLGAEPLNAPCGGAPDADACPECGSPLVGNHGCAACPSCGYSLCA